MQNVLVFRLLIAHEIDLSQASIEAEVMSFVVDKAAFWAE